MSGFTWNEDQQKAIDLIYKWYKDAFSATHFTLSGVAGSGKTTLAKYIAYELLELYPEDVCFVAPTGKASNVLLSKGAFNCSTIHKLIYDYFEVIEKEEIMGKRIPIRKKVFSKKPWLPLNIKLIICDEVSMVSDKMIDDLLSYGVKLLMLGDIYQLPPVGFPMNKYISNPNYRLETIMRQAEDNSILTVAMMAKNQKDIPYGKHGNNVYVEHKNSIMRDTFHKLLIKADQVICGRKKTQREINRLIRQLKGIDIYKEKYPTKGEKIICLNNSWDTFLDEGTCNYNLVNGSTGIVEDVKLLNDEQNIGKLTMLSDIVNSVSGTILFDTESFTNIEYEYEKKEAYVLSDDFAILSGFDRQGKPREELIKYLDYVISAVELKQVNAFDYGYAISCHKSQGSEYGNVLVLDESDYFKEDKFKHLYTAITRCQKNLVILKGF